MANPTLQRPLEDYIEYWEKLTPRSIRLIEKLASYNFSFTDPFNDVRGHDAFERVIEKMFEDTDKPKFKVTDRSWGLDETTAYLRWVMTFYPKGSDEQWTIHGMSEVLFDMDGKVMSHTDYWDSGSQLLNRLPIIGWLFRKIAAKIGTR